MALAQRPELQEWVKALARRYGRDPLWPDLVEVVILVESGGDPDAVGRDGEMGLMQLMPATAAELGVTDPFDPEQNVEGGTRYLTFLHERYRHPQLDPWPWALAAYNWGLGNVDRVLGEWSRVPGSVREYAEGILSIADERDVIDDVLDIAFSYDSHAHLWVAGFGALLTGLVVYVATEPRKQRRSRK